MEIIEDGDDLYRRLAPSHINITDGSVNSNAFKRSGTPDPSISVDLARLTTPGASIARAPSAGFGLGIVVTKVPRALELGVRHAPLPENDAHSLIEGENTREKCRRLAEATQVHTAPMPPAAH